MNSKDELSVVCMLWGNWGGGRGINYVNRLYHGVKNNLSIPHRFICFADKYSDKLNPHIEVLPLAVPNWRWNLKKMILYKPNNGLTGRVLALDLDILITGSLDDIVMRDDWFITCRGAFAKKGEYKVGGSVIGFDAGNFVLQSRLWQPLLNGTRKKIESITQGSERKYFSMMLGDIVFWQDKLPGQILSYKVDIKRKGLNKKPKDARIIRFHGRPRPHEVKNEPIIKEYW